MGRPQTPGAGITGTATKSLPGDTLQATEFGPELLRRYIAALRIDREADVHPVPVHHSSKEHAVHRNYVTAVALQAV